MKYTVAYSHDVKSFFVCKTDAYKKSIVRYARSKDNRKQREDIAFTFCNTKQEAYAVCSELNQITTENESGL